MTGDRPPQDRHRTGTRRTGSRRSGRHRRVDTRHTGTRVAGTATGADDRRTAAGQADEPSGAARRKRMRWALVAAAVAAGVAALLFFVVFDDDRETADPQPDPVAAEAGDFGLPPLGGVVPREEPIVISWQMDEGVDQATRARARAELGGKLLQYQADYRIPGDKLQVGTRRMRPTDQVEALASAVSALGTRPPMLTLNKPRDAPSDADRMTLIVTDDSGRWAQRWREDRQRHHRYILDLGSSGDVPADIDAAPGAAVVLPAGGEQPGAFALPAARAFADATEQGWDYQRNGDAP